MYSLLATIPSSCRHTHTHTSTQTHTEIHIDTPIGKLYTRKRIFVYLEVVPSSNARYRSLPSKSVRFEMELRSKLRNCRKSNALLTLTPFMLHTSEQPKTGCRFWSTNRASIIQCDSSASPPAKCVAKNVRMAIELESRQTPILLLLVHSLQSLLIANRALRVLLCRKSCQPPTTEGIEN